MVATWGITQLEVSVVKMIITVKKLIILYYNILMIILLCIINGHVFVKVLEIPEALTINTTEESPCRPRAISEVIDAVATPNTPNVSDGFKQPHHSSIFITDT